MSYEIIEKLLQHYSNPAISANRVIFVPYFDGRTELGEFCINGKTVVVNNKTEFVRILNSFRQKLKPKDTPTTKPDVNRQFKDNPIRTIILVKNLNWFLQLNGAFLKQIFTFFDVAGRNVNYVFKLVSTNFILVELQDCIDYEFEDDAAAIDKLVVKRMAEGVELPHICFSYAYGTYRTFKRKHKEAFQSTRDLVNKCIDMKLHHFYLINEMKKNPSILKINSPLTFTTLSENIYYYDRHDCWDYYLFTLQFPYGKPLEITHPTFANVVEYLKQGKHFDIRATILFDGDYEPAYKEPQIRFKEYTEFGDSVYELIGTEIDLAILREFYDMDKVLKIKVQRLYVYPESKALPAQYLDCIKSLIIDKHCKEKGTLEQVRAKEALKIQIGKSIRSLNLLSLYIDENNDIQNEPEGLNDITVKRKLYVSYQNIFLPPQVGLRCQAAERYHILKVERDLTEMGCEIFNIDTDGIIYQDMFGDSVEYFKKINKEINEKFKIEVDGKDLNVGVWDLNGFYKKFMSLGKKMYVGETYEGEVKSTIAGCCRKLDEFDFEKVELEQRVEIEEGRIEVKIDTVNKRVIRTKEKFEKIKEEKIDENSVEEFI